MFIFLSNHEPSDVLEEYQWDHPLRTQLYKVGSFLGALTEEDSVVGYDTHLLAVEFAETSHQGRPILFFVLLELGTIEDSGQNSPGVERFFEVRRYNVVQVRCIIERLLDVGEVEVHQRSVQLNQEANTLEAMLRPSQRACSSFSAKWSETPDILVWTRPPPSSSEVTISPVAALTRGLVNLYVRALQGR